MNPRPRPRRSRPGQPCPAQHRQKRPRTDRLARLVRRWRLDRNPLRRRSDRVETVVFGVLLAVFLAGAPFAAHAAGDWTYATSAREAHAQQATLHHVPATMLQTVPNESPSVYADGGALPDGTARWRAPDGKVRTNLVYVPGGATAGSTVQVWVTQSGQQSDPPLQRAQITNRIQLAEELAVRPGRRARDCRWADPGGAQRPQADRVGRGLARHRAALEPPPIAPRPSGDAVVTEVRGAGDLWPLRCRGGRRRLIGRSQ